MKKKVHKEKRTQKTGRPTIPIDMKVVDSLLEAGCTGEEVAAYVGVHSDTLFRHICKEKNVDCFTTYATEKRQKGESVLRAKQYESAVKDKNIPMQIWLGKQRLNQRDKTETDITSKGESISIQFIPAKNDKTD